MIRSTTAKKLFFGAVLLLGLSAGAQSARAATLQVSPASGSYQIGDTLRVAVTVTSSAQAINAVSGVLSFPTDKLQFLSATKDGSIMTIWAQDPAYAEAGSTGTVSFEGVVPNPGFTGSAGKILTVAFRVKAVGAANLTFSSASVLANDGMGTNVLTSFAPGVFTLGATSTVPLAPPVAQVQIPGVPQAPKITSSTHGNSSAWYQNNSPEFSWQLPAGTTGVSLLLDTSPSTNPGTQSVGTLMKYTAANLADGVWYLHVRFKNENGWGAIGHFRFQIDRVLPESFTISEIKKDDPKNPISKFLFVASDKTSGIQSYEVQIDKTYFVPWTDDGSHIYAAESLGPGNHTIVAKAIDRAGNFISASAAFIVVGINAPVITEYPSYLRSGSYLLLKGLTYPNTEIDVYIRKASQGNFFTSQPLVFTRTHDALEDVQKVFSNNRGEFTFVSQNKLQSGTYEVWAKAVNELGASSNPTPTLAIPVSAGAFAKIGIFAINIFLVLFILLAVLLVLAFMLIHGHYKVRHLRERLISKYFGSDSRPGLTSLDADLQKEIIAIQKKIAEKEKVTQEEKAFLVRIKDILSAVEEVVEQDVDGLKDR